MAVLAIPRRSRQPDADEVRVLKTGRADRRRVRRRDRRGRSRCSQGWDPAIQSRYADAFRRLIAAGVCVRWTDLRMTYEGYPERHAEQGVAVFEWGNLRG